jgi:glycosyltransferase involved in cell wall biosynthesis
VNRQPLITVIVPVYNTAQYLSKCVDSILAQTWGNLEIFLVDDGSTDNSAEIIRGYEEKHPKIIKTVFQGNAGQGSARNAALDIMTGEYISFVDSDDWILPDMFTDMLANLKGTKSDIVSCDYQIVNEQGNIIQQHSCGDIAEQGENLQDNISLAFSLEPQVTSKLFKSYFFTDKQYRFPIKMWYEDLAILPSILSSCERISKVPTCYYQYFKRDGTTTTTFNLKVLDGLLATSHIESLFMREGKFDTYKHYIHSQQFRICYLTCLRIALINDAKQRKHGFKVIRNYLKQRKYLFTTNDFLQREVPLSRIIFKFVYFKAGNVIYYAGKLRELLKSLKSR